MITAHADKLTKKYMNLEKYPFKRINEKRIIFKIKPEHVYIMPAIKHESKVRFTIFLNSNLETLTF